MAESSNLSFVLLSVQCETGMIRVVWMDPANEDVHGRSFRADEILLEEALVEEVRELTDAAHQLVASWMGLRRERTSR